MILNGMNRLEKYIQWICDSCIIALYEAGIMYCGYETNNGRSADYDIRSIYETKLCEDF